MAMVYDVDILTWGRLVKSWATGLDYLTTDFANQPPTVPIPPGANWALPPMASVPVSVPAGTHATIPHAVAMTAHDFAQRMKNAGISDVDLGTGIKTVIVVQGNEHTVMMRLPPKAGMQAAEMDLLNGEIYGIPAFYEDLYTIPGTPTQHAHPPNGLTDRSGMLKLHANRIGDYSMGLCQ